MKCFQFINGERRSGDEDDEQDGTVPRKVSWARSLSIASTNMDMRRSEIESESLRDWADSSVPFQNLLNRRRANDLRAFSFSELKSATRGFSRALLIGEGGFGCVFRGSVRIQDSGSGLESTIDVAIKHLNRNGLQGTRGHGATKIISHKERASMETRLHHTLYGSSIATWKRCCCIHHTDTTPTSTD